LFRRGLKLSPNDVYDDLVHRTFKNMLRPDLIPLVTFARRGKTDRLQALKRALLAETQDQAEKVHAVEVAVRSQTELDDLIRLVSAMHVSGPIRGVSAAYPDEERCLQIVDYYLWAIQRMLERNEDRFFRLLERDFRLVMDLDDTRRHPYGQWYSASNPIALEKVLPVTG